MLGSKTSYQKLKNRNKELEERIAKILDDPNEYKQQRIARKIAKDVSHRIMWGDHKPNKKLKFDGLFQKMVRNL